MNTKQHLEQELDKFRRLMIKEVEYIVDNKFDRLVQFFSGHLIELQEAVNIEAQRKLLGAKDARIKELEKKLGILVDEQCVKELQEGFALDEDGEPYHIETRRIEAQELLRKMEEEVGMNDNENLGR